MDEYKETGAERQQKWVLDWRPSCPRNLPNDWREIRQRQFVLPDLTK